MRPQSTGTPRALIIVTEREETPLEMSERHVEESEARIARQKALLETMERDNHPDTAARARHVLAIMEETLRLLRQHVEMLRGRQ